MPEIGQTLSHYRVVEKIGQVGMGEVYLADDTTLDRKVTLKFLPDAFTSDPERTARFEREAKLLASPNHPNIAGICGLEQADGNCFTFSTNGRSVEIYKSKKDFYEGLPGNPVKRDFRGVIQSRSVF